MFKKIPNGTKFIIDGPEAPYECWVPPIGYGTHADTGEVAKTDVIKRSAKKSEQFWERQTLPANWAERCEKELQIRETDKNFIDAELQEIRKREWRRRIYGVWFYNNGEPVYITGQHYMLLNYWKFQGKWFDYREPNRDYYYVLQYCIEDPNCLGLIEVTKRKEGKCFAAGTKIRMYDGSVKNVEDVIEGDLVMGDDSTPRIASGITTGRETMYEIKANKGDGFTCNASHILALEWNGLEKPNYRGWKKGDKINISVKEYLALKEWEKDHLVMYRKGWGAESKNSLNFGFTIIEKPEDNYYGFTVDKNHLFLLADGTVVHNTARGGLFIYEYISRTEARHGGIQSKTDGDAQEVFQKAIVTPWRKLPEFFKPIFDRSAGDNPTKELRFFNTSQKGKKKNEEDAALESFIDYKSAQPLAYDGPELHRYLSDEAGKLVAHSIADRHDVVQFCSEVDGVFVGKHLYTTTVEEMEAGGSEFRKLVNRSNRNERDENGRTKSGLYMYFLPSFKTMFYNRYGQPDERKGRDYFMNRRKALENDTRALSSFIRKNPFTLEEAFRIDGDKCLYDAEKLNNQLDRLSWGENHTTRGNFVWEKGERDTRVVFQKDKSGRWEVTMLFEKQEDSNLVSRAGNYFQPLNTLKFVMAADPFSHDIVVDNRRSNGAGVVKMKFDAMSSSPYNDSFVCKYLARPEAASIYYEDMLKTAVYYGCQVLFESNKNNWKDYFINRGYEPFLMKLPGYSDYGIPGNKQTHQQLAEVTEEYILNKCDKVFFKDMLKDWLEFDINNTTKFDTAMAAGYALIADGKKLYQRASEMKAITKYGGIFKKTKLEAL